MKLLKEFFDGMINATSVINHGDIPSYRQVESEKYSKLDGKFSYIFLCKYLLKDVVFKRVRKISLSFSEVLYAGHTTNNIKEFENFYNWCDGLLNIDDYPNQKNNLSMFESNRNYNLKVKKHLLLKLLLSLIVFISFLFRFIKLNKTSYKYVSDYTNSFIKYYINYYNQKNMCPSVLVLSNDHNPNYVAISKVFKLLLVNRVYMQHGGVSLMFPPIDFEMSVLFNDDSKEIYQSISKKTFKCLCISRGDINTNIGEIDYPDVIDVIICPTSIVSIVALNNLIDTLSSNINVGSVYIKYHPRFKEHSLVEGNCTRVESLNEISNYNQCIYIVGNSTVSLDLALKGMQVFQCFEIDDIGRDYYGYVSRKVCSEIFINQVGKVFWERKFRANLEELVRFSPILKGEQEENIKKLRVYISNILSNSSRHNDGVFNKKYQVFLKKHDQEINAFYEYQKNNPNVDLVSTLLKSEAITTDEACFIRKAIFSS